MPGLCEAGGFRQRLQVADGADTWDAACLPPTWRRGRQGESICTHFLPPDKLLRHLEATNPTFFATRWGALEADVEKSGP